MKAFKGSQDIKQDAIRRAALARMGGHFYAWGHYWHHEGGKCRGNVSGAVLSHHLKEGQPEQACPDYWEPMLGIPWQVGELLDVFFSGLSLHENKDIHHGWAEQVFNAIRPGADLSAVPDNMVAYILETPEWLATYSDEECAHLIGYMHGIFTLRLNGIDQAARIKDFYYKNIHKKHHSRFATASNDCKLENYGWGALRHLCSVDQHRGPMGYFLGCAVKGSARNKRVHQSKQWVELSQIFLQMIEDC